MSLLPKSKNDPWIKSKRNRIFYSLFSIFYLLFAAVACCFNQLDLIPIYDSIRERSREDRAHKVEVVAWCWLGAWASRTNVNMVADRKEQCKWSWVAQRRDNVRIYPTWKWWLGGGLRWHQDSDNSRLRLAVGSIQHGVDVQEESITVDNMKDVRLMAR